MFASIAKECLLTDAAFCTILCSDRKVCINGWERESERGGHFTPFFYIIHNSDHTGSIVQRLLAELSVYACLLLGIGFMVGSIFKCLCMFMI